MLSLLDMFVCVQTYVFVRMNYAYIGCNSFIGWVCKLLSDIPYLSICLCPKPSIIIWPHVSLYSGRIKLIRVLVAYVNNMNNHQSTTWHTYLSINRSVCLSLLISLSLSLSLSLPPPLYRCIYLPTYWSICLLTIMHWYLSIYHLN